MKKAMSFVVWGCVASVLGGTCAISAAPAEITRSEQLVAHMHEHYNYLKQIQAAIIRGELSDISEPARWLAEHPAPKDIPAAWKPYDTAMRDAARAAGSATTIADAATAASQMAIACGRCHTENNIADQFPRLTEPEDVYDNVGHMERHQWAADRMWEGLIGPSHNAWGQGADLLLEVPLTVDDLNAEDDNARSIRNMERRIHQLAGNATVKFDDIDRAKLYAEFLSTCAACHTRLRQGPAKP